MTNPSQVKNRLDLVREGATGTIGKRGRLVVGLERVIEDPHNERKVFRNMEGLTASVRAVGLIEPLTVSQLEDGRYQIITGHRRFRAAKAAALETIEVIIRDADSEKNRRQKSIISNVQREDIGPVEMAEALQGLLDEDDEIESQGHLAQVIGKDKSWVSQMLRILDLPVHLRTKVETSQLSLPYDAISKIARLTDVQLQEELIEELLSGASNREIRERIKNTKTGTEKGTEAPQPKPKKVYRTEQKVVIIVQSETKTLTPERTLAALQEAIKQARKDSRIE